MKNKLLLVAILFAYSILGYSQNDKQVAEITRNYDVALIKQKIIEVNAREKRERKIALETAKQKGWPVFVENTDGSIEEIYKITPFGFPLYRKTDNVAAGISTRTNFLHTGGGLNLSLDGQSMIARVWDGGTVRRSHSGFGGRVITVDDEVGASFNQHATHVAGTVIASPWSTGSANIKGMAPVASARTFNWTDDESEALSEGLIGMLVSNHSYGVPVTSTNGTTLPAWYIGSYVQDSRNWDEIAYLSPYYLPVFSAGNDGNNNNNTDPIAFGYDKLVGNKVSKNVLTIANAQDATINANGTLSNVLINSSSSQGPTDDRRIKPDITGNGSGVLSLSSGSNSQTANLSGTSMAAPNVTGTLLLLQQYHNQLHNYFMKAATLKGLVCHTADDAGDIGPDPVFGWGLLNAKKAAETLRDNGLNSWISENTLNQGNSFSMTVKSNGGASNPLIASISWTDLPGEANNGQRLDPNNTFRSLINDLDIRITRDGTTYFPWRLQLDPNMGAIRNGDNNVDNIEVIRIDNPPAGDYLITVTHKGNLATGKQDYSLVVTGIASNIALASTSDDLIKCSNENAVYTFNYRQTGSGTTNFTPVGIPNGATATINPTSLSANGVVTLTISNLNSANAGDYNVGILASNTSETETRTKKLKLFKNSFEPVTLSSPANGFNGASTIVNLSWNSDNNAENYIVQVSNNPNFSPILTQQSTSNTSALISGLQQETTYYWRVSQSNRCGSANLNNSNINSFSTGILSCGNVFTATDYSNATVAATANASASVPVQVTGGFSIGELKVTLAMTHTYVQDMTIRLRGPVTIGSPIITLLREACTSQDDINCIFVDNGGQPQCSETPPAIFSLIAPEESLSNLNGLSADGEWTLLIDDPYNGDGGTVSNFSLEVCNVTLNSNSFITSNFKVYPNPSKGIININLGDVNGETLFTLYDVQGRTVLTKKSNTAIESLNIENLSNGIYMLSIENGAAKTTQKIILNK
ncbi:MAG: S8 family serine peptidase [Chitinophagaceae bacterium]|jgi:subtilisin-like proprotein convertase family protein|nr:S8 family serine peptidase [Chitinophagaceae bacterium]